MRRLAALAPLACLVAAVILFAGWSLKRNPQVTPMAMVGKPAPDVVLARLDGGGRQPLRAAIQGPTLVNFFASWCGPCIQEAPALMALKAEGVRIVGIDYKDTPAAGQAVLRRLGNPYAETLADPDGSVGIDFGVTGVPETYAVDVGGMIRAKRATPIDPAAAETLLEAAAR